MAPYPGSSWISIRSYNLQFAGLELKDNNRDTVLKSSYLTIGWTVSSLYDYLVHDSGVASLVKSVTVEDPEIDLRQGQDNSWNIQDILKPSDDTNSQDIYRKSGNQKRNHCRKYR